jgi:hypothetical protein
MTNKVYRTAQGKRLDLGEIQLKNEKTRAVGNMNVNARGDKVNAQNNPIEARTTGTTKQYRRQSNVSDDIVYEKASKKTEG